MSRLRRLGSLFAAPGTTELLAPPAANADHLDDPYYSGFKYSAQPQLLLDERGLFDCNEAAVQLFAAQNAQQLSGLHPGDLSPALQPAGKDSFELADERVAQALRDGVLVFAWRHRTLHGLEFDAEGTLSPFEARGPRTPLADG